MAYIVIAYFETNDKAAAEAAQQMIVEGRTFTIDKRAITPRHSGALRSGPGMTGLVGMNRQSHTTTSRSSRIPPCRR